MIARHLSSINLFWVEDVQFVRDVQALYLEEKQAQENANTSIATISRVTCL